MSSVVQKGDKIHVPAELLGGEKSKTVTVTWSQKMKTRTQDYYVCTFDVKSGGNSDGAIWVQADKIDELKSRKADGEDFTFTVDESFQYGQNKDMTKRFLVFHDTDNRPYQHRFVENTLAKYGYMASDMTEKLGAYSTHTLVDITKNFVGDYLHSY